MLRLVPAGSKVALIAGIVGDIGSNARIQGFKEATEGKLDRWSWSAPTGTARRP